MKKLITAVLVAALLFVCTACGQNTAAPEEGLSSPELYTAFTEQLRSGELSKVHIKLDSWYSAVTSQAEKMRFCTQEDGTRALLYRARTPFVFWYYPPYDYYDGTQYYYKYKDEWLIDRTGKYNNVKSQDFLALRESFLVSNTVYSDAVYREANGYLLETTLQSPDRRRYYTLTGTTDIDFQFSKIDVKAYLYDFDAEEYRLTDIYHFRYHNLNRDIPVAQPDDLSPASVANQTTAQPT